MRKRFHDAEPWIHSIRVHFTIYNTPIYATMMAFFNYNPH
jgi:hypothetical protein